MKRIRVVWLALCLIGCSGVSVFAQGMGNSGTITGTVTDPSGATIPNATIEIHNKVTGFDKNTTTDAMGAFKLLGVPLNNYHTVVKAAGFQDHVEDVMVQTTVPVNLMVMMALASSTTSVDVQGDADLLESVPPAHVDV